MVKVTNAGRDSVNFLKKGGKVVGGVPETVSLAAGETGDIDVDPNDVAFKAALTFGNLTAADSVLNKAAEAMATEDTAAAKRK